MTPLLKNGKTERLIGSTLEDELAEMQNQLDFFIDEEKKPPLKENGEIDWDAYGARVRARLSLQAEYHALKKKLEELEQEKSRLDETKLTDEVKAECIKVKRAYGIPDSFNNRKINLWQIRNAEKEIAECKGCTGYCQKKRKQGYYPTITFNEKYQEIYITSHACAFEKERRAQAKLKRMQGLSKIPPEYADCTFEDYRVDQNNAYAVKVAKALVEHSEKGAFFFGNVGTGKTFLAAITAQEIIKRGRQVIFATVPAISKQLRSTFGGNSKVTEAEILEQLETAPTLILDDVGMEKPTRFVCSTLCNLFNERYNARLQTIMTSNYTLKELENIFNNPSDGGTTLDGTRIYDRCKQMCAPVELKGKSRRA